MKKRKIIARIAEYSAFEVSLERKLIFQATSGFHSLSVEMESRSELSFFKHSVVPGLISKISQEEEE